MEEITPKSLLDSLMGKTEDEIIELLEEYGQQQYIKGSDAVSESL